MGAGEFGHREAIGQGQRRICTEQKIRAGRQQVGYDRGLAAKALKSAQEVMQGSEECDKDWMQHEAGGEVHHLCAAFAVQPERNAVAVTTSGEVHATALAWAGPGNWLEFDIVEAGAVKRGGQQVGFAGDVACVIQVLQGAATARTEVRAGPRPLASSCKGRWKDGFVSLYPNAEMPVWARPRIRACTSWVPS